MASWYEELLPEQAYLLGREDEARERDQAEAAGEDQSIRARELARILDRVEGIEPRPHLAEQAGPYDQEAEAAGRRKESGGHSRNPAAAVELEHSREPQPGLES